MAYTVKQLAGLSGVSVRTLRFYDQTSLLKPACRGRNRYRFYEEPQLLKLQQILFYRELGFELKRIKRVLGRPDFEVAAALRSHRTGLLADAFGVREAIFAIAGLTAASGIVVAARMYETHPRHDPGLTVRHP